ncbi:tyrosine-type recombinase/integrase [Chloroflexota bacterium]
MNLFAFQRVPVSFRLTPLQLRHYIATRALSNGADVKAVSQFLGHADVTITLKVYHHVTPKAIREMHREYSPIKNCKKFTIPKT